MQKRSASKKVSVVIVTYNSAEVIEECLKSIADGIKIFIVDNASTDETIKIIKATKPNAILIQNENNLGFVNANNIALEKIDSEYAFLLNPDTILEENTIEELTKVADKYEESAIVSPTLCFKDGKLQQSYKAAFYIRENIKTKYIEPSGDLCAECLSGAAMLLRMKYFKKIGFFDPEIFLFYEDDDICLKAMQESYSLILTPNSKVIHHMGESTPQSSKLIFFKNKHMLWSRLYLQEKYFDKHKAKMASIQLLYFYLMKFLLKICMFNYQKSAKALGSVVGCLYYFIGKKP
jgi:N-acetylglucosaminyl-diphospho-decaprenol L-rhamnosyltransferase